MKRQVNKLLVSLIVIIIFAILSISLGAVSHPIVGLFLLGIGFATLSKI